MNLRTYRNWSEAARRDLKLAVLTALPSLTRTVICAIPMRFRAGVTVCVRFDPVPAHTIPWGPILN